MVATSDLFQPQATSIVGYVFVDLPPITDLCGIFTNHRSWVYFLFIDISCGIWLCSIQSTCWPLLPDIWLRKNYILSVNFTLMVWGLPSVPWHCWLGVRKSIQREKKTEWCIWWCWCHCHPITSCFIKIQNLYR